MDCLSFNVFWDIAKDNTVQDCSRLSTFSAWLSCNLNTRLAVNVAFLGKWKRQFNYPKSTLSTCRFHQFTTNEEVCKMLSTSAWHGDLAQCQWLTECFGLTAKNIRAHQNNVLDSAINGHLNVFQWAVERFNMTTKDVRSFTNYWLRFTAQNGHLDVLQYIVKHFGLTIDDARACDNFALRSAARHGHLAVVQWLVQYFGLKLNVNDAKLNR